MAAEIDDCEFRINTIRPHYAAALEQLQRDCFPTLGAR